MADAEELLKFFGAFGVGGGLLVLLAFHLFKKSVDNLTSLWRERELKQLDAMNARSLAALQASLGVFAQIDTDLRARRIDVYRDLWRATEILPLWPRRSHVPARELKSLSLALSEWYFRTGGMFLSRPSQHAYADLQDALSLFRWDEDLRPITADEYEELRRLCSTLRTSLTRDVQSRRSGPSEEEVLQHDDQRAEELDARISEQRNRRRPVGSIWQDGQWRACADDRALIERIVERYEARWLEQIRREPNKIGEATQAIARELGTGASPPVVRSIDVRRVLLEGGRLPVEPASRDG